jgi:HlyD family secretion protein
MTTSNKIIASVKDSALFIPLETLHSHFDTITFVYKKDGINTIKQEVMVGETNANDAVVLGGLREGDKLFLSVPEGLEEKDFLLLPEMNGKRKRKEEEKPADKVIPAVVEPSAKAEVKVNAVAKKKG